MNPTPTRVNRNTIQATRSLALFALFLSLPALSQPPNDLCTNVTTATLNTGSTLIFSGNNTGATFAGDAAPGSPMDLGLPSVWHAFTTSACADVVVAYCGINPAFGNTWNWLSTDCPASSMVNATTFNTTDCGDGNKTIYFNNLPAGTYYLPVLTDPFANSQGPYTIQVSASSCGSNSPPNDLCTSVVPATLNTGSTLIFSGNNTGATFPGDAAPGSPMDLGLPSVWHAFTTTACADVVVAYCGINPAFGNTWNWLSTDCPANSMVNATTFNTTDCGDGNKTIYFNNLPAGTYYLPVLTDPFANSQGPYTIQVSASSCGSNSPPNDLCTSVVPATLITGATITFTGNNTGATFPGDAAPGSPMDLGLPSVWHAFTTSACADVVVAYCGINPAFGNTWNWLSTDCPASSMVNATTFNTTDCGDGNKTLYFNNLPAGTYYLPVLTDPFANSQGPYTIQVSASSCGSNSPPNDLCTSVVPATLNTGSTLIFSGNNTGATFAGDAAPGSPMDLGLPSVWHAFTTSACADVVVAYCGINPAFGNTWNWLSTDCPASSMVNATTFNTTDCGDGNKTIYFNNLPAGTYYLPVLTDPFANSQGPYTIQVSASSCGSNSPPNDLCTSVAAPLLNPGGSLTYTGNSTGATFTDDAVPGSIIALVGLPNVWHAFTIEQCLDLRVEYCGTTPAFTNVWNLLATSCPADDLVFSTSNNSTDCGDGNRTAYYVDVLPGTYWIPVLVDPFSGSVGPYTVSVHAALTCQSVGLAEAAESMVTVHPNPAKDRLWVTAPGWSGTVHLQLLDASGRLVGGWSRNAGGAPLLLELPALATGQYLLRAVHASGVAGVRVAVE